MTSKPHDTGDQSMPVAAEPATVYGRIVGNDEKKYSHIKLP